MNPLNTMVDALRGNASGISGQVDPSASMYYAPPPVTAPMQHPQTQQQSQTNQNPYLNKDANNFLTGVGQYGIPKLLNGLGGLGAAGSTVDPMAAALSAGPAVSGISGASSILSALPFLAL